MFFGFMLTFVETQDGHCEVCNWKTKQEVKIYSLAPIRIYSIGYPKDSWWNYPKARWRQQRRPGRCTRPPLHMSRRSSLPLHMSRRSSLHRWTSNKFQVSASWGSSFNPLRRVCFCFLDLNLNSAPLLTLTIDSFSTSPIFLDILSTFFHILSQKFFHEEPNFHHLDRLLLHLRAEDGEVSN